MGSHSSHDHHHEHTQDHDHAGHDHSHGGHHHHHTGNIQVAFWLNFIFCLIEFAGGWMTNSVAILSDALHDLGDSFSLGLAWYFQKIAVKKRDAVFSYGYKRFSLLGALINAMILLIGSVFIIKESVVRVLNPEASNAQGMIWFAVLGIVVNGAAILRLKRGSSINEKVISLHLMEDVLGWVAVLIAAVVMLFVEWPVLDPLLSLGITGYILYNVFKNLKHSLSILLQAVPFHLNEKELKQKLLAIPKIIGVHDIHAWSMDGQYHIVSMHLVIDDQSSLHQAEDIKAQVRTLMRTLNIHHVTIETESQQVSCALENC